jgi:hypothetical protein
MNIYNVLKLVSHYEENIHTVSISHHRPQEKI